MRKGKVSGLEIDKERPSRTQKKKEDKALTKLGEELVSLSSDQLEDIDMPDLLLEAVIIARETKAHGAKRRQIRHVGALLRSIDSEPIRHALGQIQLGDIRKNLAFKKIETWRDELKAGNKELVEEILRSCPDAERQRLTQLTRNARMEAEAATAVKYSRVLFRYLREVSKL